MWVFMKHAMVSIVSDRTDPTADRLLVRARLEGDLEQLFPSWADDVIELKASDYRFRVSVPRGEVMDAIYEEIKNINYPNFKAAVLEPARERAYMNVWSAMFMAQQREEFG